MSTPTYDFSDRVVFVTGAARGMGRNHALRFAEFGADVVAVDKCADTDGLPIGLGTEAQLEETVAGIRDYGVDALPIVADVTDEAQVEAAVDTALDEFGQIDVLVNNAGVGDFGELTELDEARWDAVLDTNLKGVWLCSKHVGKHFKERSGGGRIVSTSSTTGIVGQHGMGHYAASKHGVVGLTKSLALELAEHDVTVNCVCPTGTDTPGVAATNEVYGSEYIERASDLSGPWNIFGTGMIDPDDVTQAYLWLASDAAGVVTGIALPVDAGFTAK